MAEWTEGKPDPIVIDAGPNPDHTCPECELAVELIDARAETAALLSAIKQHRNATESRLRHFDSRGEAARCMLKPDRDLYDALERQEEQ